MDSLVEPSSLALLMDCLEIEDDERTQVHGCQLSHVKAGVCVCRD